MKLSYRGTRYLENAASTLEVTEGDIGGTYRGQQWKFHYLRHIPEPPPVHNLKWRGIPYRMGRPEVVDSTPTSQPIAAVATSRCPHPPSRKKVLDQLTLMHLENIQRNLAHRLEVAKAKGDDQLVRLLEKESEQLSFN